MIQANFRQYKVNIFEDDQYITPCVLQTQQWDSWMEKYIVEATMKNPSGVIVDVGGHIGLNALMFSDYAPVHTYEPMFFDTLYKNIITNSKPKFPIFTYDIGLSHTKCTRDIYVPSKSNNKVNYGNCSLTEPDSYSDCKTIQLVTLDSCKIKDPVFIKIDVEGHEYEVIRGAENTIRTYKPTLCVELWDVHTSQVPQLLFDTFGYSDIIKECDANYIFK